MSQVAKPGLRSRMQKVLPIILQVWLILTLIVTVVYAWTLHQSNLTLKNKLKKCEDQLDIFKNTQALSLGLGILSIVALVSVVILMLKNSQLKTLNSQLKTLNSQLKYTVKKIQEDLYKDVKRVENLIQMVRTGNPTELDYKF